MMLVPCLITMWLSLKPMKVLLHVLEWWNTPPLQQLTSSSLPSMSPTPPDVDVSELDFLCLACHEVIFNRGHLPYYVSVIVLFSLFVSLPTHCRDTMSSRHQKLVEKLFPCSLLS